MNLVALRKQPGFKRLKTKILRILSVLAESVLRTVSLCHVAVFCDAFDRQLFFGRYCSLGTILHNELRLLLSGEKFETIKLQIFHDGHRPNPYVYTPLYTSVWLKLCFNPSAWSDGHCPHTVNITCRGVTGTARIQ